QTAQRAEGQEHQDRGGRGQQEATVEPDGRLELLGDHRGRGRQGGVVVEVRRARRGVAVTGRVTSKDGEEAPAFGQRSRGRSRRVRGDDGGRRRGGEHERRDGGRRPAERLPQQVGHVGQAGVAGRLEAGQPL